MSPRSSAASKELPSSSLQQMIKSLKSRTKDNFTERMSTVNHVGKYTRFKMVKAGADIHSCTLMMEENRCTGFRQ